MEKVESVELYHVSIPLPKPFFPTWIWGYPQTHNRFTLIRVRTKSGVEGVSAGAAFEIVDDLPVDLSFGIRGSRSTGHGGLEVDYALDQAGTPVVEDFDTTGRRIRGAQILGAEAGPHRWLWDGEDETGRRMPSGVYFVRLRLGERTSVATGILLR